MKKILFAIAAVLSINTSLQAETLVYQAIEDFPDIDSGEVPYYVHNRESALAINAVVEDYRDKFARATTLYSGNGGIYDVTISALGELDGEGEYRFLVNGDIVGTAVNVRVDEDYGVQNHIFEDISIPVAAEIAVESNAVSNGLVPENDIFAFARGRWTTLTLEADDPVTLPAFITVDLSVSAASDKSIATVGDTIQYTLDVTNNHLDNVATSPVVGILLPGSMSFAASSDCTADGRSITCNLQELAASQTAVVNFSAVANIPGTATMIISASAAEAEVQEKLDDNEILYSISVSSANTPVAEPDNTNPTPETGTANTGDPAGDESASGGGGSTTPITILLLSLIALCAGRRRDKLVA